MCSLLPTAVVADARGVRRHPVDRLDPDAKKYGTNASKDGETLLDAVNLLDALRDDRELLPTPAAADGKRGPDLARVYRPNSGGHDLVTVVERLLPGRELLPTPAASVPNDGEDPAVWKERHDRHASRDDNPTRSGLPLSIAVGDLDPGKWGKYAEAIACWELITDTKAPPPTTSPNRLNPRFSEWMLGLPAGYVTTLLPRRKALEAIGDAVQPQTALHAFRSLSKRINNNTPTKGTPQ